MSDTSPRFALLAGTALLLFLPFTLTFGATPARRAAQQATKQETVTFADLTGKSFNLRDHQNTPAVYFFLSTECPVANRYTSRILAMERAFKPIGVQIFAVYPNENESEEDIRQHATDWGLTCPVVKDDGRLVKHFGITMTPEAALVNNSGEMVYRGRIDDNVEPEQVRSRDLATAVLAMYSGRPVAHARTEPFGCPLRYVPKEMIAREKKAALPTVANGTGRSLPPPAVRPGTGESAAAPAPLRSAPGTISSARVPVTAPERPTGELKLIARPTNLARIEVKTDETNAAPADTNPGDATVAALPNKTVVDPIKSKNGVITTSISYSRDVAPILFERCLPCHRQGEVAPFRVDTYEQAVAWAGQIRDAVVARRMPPWKADSKGEFHDEMRLTNREIAVITSWANGGTPYGHETEMPPIPVFPKGWKMGDPDAIIAMPDQYDVPADGKDIYRCFVIPTNFSSDRWVAGVEYHPGNSSVVHHVSAFIDTTGRARQLDANDPGPGYINPTPANGPGFTPVAGMLGGWVPGHSPRMLPSGVGIFLPKGADIVLEVHYHPTGRAERDRTRFGLYFSRDEITKRLHMGDVSNVNFRIPAGAQDYVVEGSAFVPDDITLLSISPHMHYIGRSMKVVATLPSGLTQVLVDVPDWDFRWQPSYRFKEPVHLPRRTRIDMIAHFDNSEKNPRNPYHPPREMTYGESTTDEMCTVFFAYTLDSEDVRNERAVATAQ